MLPIDIKERVMGLINHEDYKIIKKNELINIFAYEKIDKESLSIILNELEEDGEIIITKKGKVGALKHFSMFKGNFSSTKNGYGFVDIDEDNRYFIHEKDRNTAFDGDLVIVKQTKEKMEGKKDEGEIIKILKRSVYEVVGTFIDSKSFGFVVVDDKKFDMDVFIPKKFFSGAKSNDKVVCRIDIWPEFGKKPEGRIIEIIGKKGERYVEIDSIIRANSLPEEFPKKVMKYIDNIPDCVVENEIIDRLDLRNELTFTIDGDDSKDFDDAISVSRLNNGNYKLGVHIADVTHYVVENSPLDKEALKRATSVYLVDKVIPMLPQKLSNGICSLNPNVDRLTLSCIMEINEKGKVVNYDIQKTVINSKARLTYTEVSDILENEDESLIDKYKDFYDSFKIAEELSNILRSKRFKRGAIDFDFPESKIILDSEGVPKEIVPYERRVSNKMIEEFMLLANETVSEHYHWMKIPFVYRVHENPEEEKIIDLKKYLNLLGYKMILSRNGIRSIDLQNALNSIEDKEEKQAVGTVMLRTMKQARYSPESLGHFGLAAEYYSHFTSPIRRYPDLQIHRIIKEVIDGKINDERINHYDSILGEVCDISSKKEREAEQAEREVNDYYKSVFMSDNIGREFSGHISSITSFGMFIELPNGIDGLVRLQDLEDYYIFHEDSRTLVGERNGVVYKMGQKVKVVVDRVNVDLREIDFIFK